MNLEVPSQKSVSKNDSSKCIVADISDRKILFGTTQNLNVKLKGSLENVTTNEQGNVKLLSCVQVCFERVEGITQNNPVCSAVPCVGTRGVKEGDIERTCKFAGFALQTDSQQCKYHFFPFASLPCGKICGRVEFKGHPVANQKLTTHLSAEKQWGVKIA